LRMEPVVWGFFLGCCRHARDRRKTGVAANDIAETMKHKTPAIILSTSRIHRHRQYAQLSHGRLSTRLLFVVHRGDEYGRRFFSCAATSLLRTRQSFAIWYNRLIVVYYASVSHCFPFHAPSSQVSGVPPRLLFCLERKAPRVRHFAASPSRRGRTFQIQATLLAAAKNDNGVVEYTGGGTRGL